MAPGAKQRLEVAGTTLLLRGSDLAAGLLGVLRAFHGSEDPDGRWLERALGDAGRA